MDSLEYYVAEGYYVINDALRSGNISPDIRLKINEIIDLINHEGKPAQQEILLYRFTDYPPYLTAEIGDVIIDRAFFSQTADEKYARECAAATGGVLLHVYWEHLPRALYLKEESEVLNFPKGKFPHRTIKSSEGDKVSRQGDIPWSKIGRCRYRDPLWYQDTVRRGNIFILI